MRKDINEMGTFSTAARKFHLSISHHKCIYIEYIVVTNNYTYIECLSRGCLSYQIWGNEGRPHTETDTSVFTKCLYLWWNENKNKLLADIWNSFFFRKMMIFGPKCLMFWNVWQAKFMIAFIVVIDLVALCCCCYKIHIIAIMAQMHLCDNCRKIHGSQFSRHEIWPFLLLWLI